MLLMLRVIYILLLFAPVPILAQEASQLGPESSSSGASSPQTLNLLQPAGGTSSPLQSADAGNGGVGQSSASQNLQETGSTIDVKSFIEGETDGGEQNPNSSPSLASFSFLLYILLVVAAAGIITAGVVALEKRTANS